MAVTTPAWAECDPVANADAVLTPGTRLFVGEMHGTNEIPRTFGALVCHATKKGGPVRVGLELPAAEDKAIATFLASVGTPADRAALVRGAFWTDPQWQDGRRSQAMVRLLDGIRALKRAGADVDVATFDDSTQPDRDRAMAERALAAIARAPKATWLLYAGNLHARKTTNQMKKTFMAQHLVEEGLKLTTLDARYGAGSAWICTPECGPQMAGRGPSRPVAVTIARARDGAYDGTLDVGTISFSPPAALPMSKAQAARAATIPQKLAAMSAYDAQQYDRCAELFGAVASQLRSPEDAYSAACCHALAGKSDLAFKALSQAIELGFSDAANLTKDTDLASLHADARWQPMVTRLSAPSAK